MSFLSSLAQYKYILLFYLILIGFIYYHRKKFQFQAKIIALYRTKLGISLMDKIAKRHPVLVRKLATIGIYVGYLGMLVILYFILHGLYLLIFIPSAPATFTPIIPGVPIPGSPIFVPFWYGIISLFIVVVIHEFSHGVVARAYNIPVKSSGFVLFGPIPGAFVEPDEKKLRKQSAKIQNSLFAAGPFSNVLTAILLIIVFVGIVGPTFTRLYSPLGIAFSTLDEGMPALAAGLKVDELYTHVNGQEIKDSSAFTKALQDLKPGDTVTIGNENNQHSVTATSRKENPEKGYLGVHVTTRYTNEDSLGFRLFGMLVEFLNWLYILSLGLGLANLLPLGPIDGGRMSQLALHKFFGAERGNHFWAKTSLFLVVMLLILIFVPIIKAVI
ncbi:MAG TPA: site-2 protease family protein [Candidatus Nanoarchaeia archaeon]|nr:site-2 protease family protein [Candidatus Nanoarchaeia archaeon]